MNNIVLDIFRALFAGLSLLPNFLLGVLNIRDSFNLDNIKYLFFSEIFGVPLWLVSAIGTIVGIVIIVINLIKKFAR